MVVRKLNLHRHFQGEDSVIGSFEIHGEEIVFPSDTDRHHCDMFPAGPMSNYTKNRIAQLLNNKEKSMWLEQVK